MEFNLEFQDRYVSNHINYNNISLVGENVSVQLSRFWKGIGDSYKDISLSTSHWCSYLRAVDLPPRGRNPGMLNLLESSSISLLILTPEIHNYPCRITFQ